MGGATLSRMASMATMADSEPAAPIRWPTIDLGELIAKSAAWAPNAALIAAVSVRSLARVDVPWAQM